MKKPKFSHSIPGFRWCRWSAASIISNRLKFFKQGVDIVICTPGRIIDYYKQGIFKTEGIQSLVIDEADRLLDLGFAKDMRYILRKLPPYDKRQSMLFSATLSYRVMELTYEYMNLPEFISITPEAVTVEGIEQSLYHVGSDRKFQLLLGLLKREEWSRMLIFVNTKAGVENLTYRLKGNGWPAEGITGDLPQRKRFQLMAQFKKGQIKILVATDVASRGIHVEDISHVINYDLPQESENYVHRIGRTARAGKTGKAISLACERYVFHLEQLEDMLDYKIPVIWPEEDWYLEDKSRPIANKRKSRPKRTDAAARPECGSKAAQRRQTSEKKKVFALSGRLFRLCPGPGRRGKTRRSSGPGLKSLIDRRRNVSCKLRVVNHVSGTLQHYRLCAINSPQNISPQTTTHKQQAPARASEPK